MPNISEIKKSNFLKKEDCGDTGILVTIREVREENVAKEGAPEEHKWCVFFNECEKPMVLNSTNAQLIAAITKQENTDNWPGARVVLYNDPSITYAGKLTGGIRVRAPRGQAANKPQPTHQALGMPGKPDPKPAPQPEPEPDDVPF